MWPGKTQTIEHIEMQSTKRFYCRSVIPTLVSFNVFHFFNDIQLHRFYEFLNSASVDTAEISREQLKNKDTKKINK